MSAPKTLNTWGFGAKIESTYGTVNAPTTTDGVLTAERPVPDTPAFLNDGMRGVTPGGGPRPPVNSSGRSGSIAASCEAIGGGAAYSASIKPSIDTLLRICGLEATLDATVSAEKWSYSSEVGPSGLESATVDLHSAGHLYRLFGAYADFEIVIDGPGIPMFNFNVQGIADFVSDVAIPAYTNYPAVGNLPPKAEAIALVIGTFTAGIVRSATFRQNRQHDAARADISGAVPSHKGFTPGTFDPELEVVVEAVTLATTSPWHTATTLNPYRLMEDRGVLNIVSMAVGSVQYKRWTLWSGAVGASAATAYVKSVTDSEDGPTRTWTIVFGFTPSTYLLNDHFNLRFT